MKKTITFLFAILLFASCTNRQEDFDFSHKEKSANSLKESAIEIECGVSKSDCETLNYQIPEGFVYSWSQMFLDGDDVYVSLLRERDQRSLDAGEWCIFKNKEEVFCDLMNAGANGPIVDMLKEEEGIRAYYLQTNAQQKIQTKEALIESF